MLFDDRLSNTTDHWMTLRNFKDHNHFKCQQNNCCLISEIVNNNASFLFVTKIVTFVSPLYCNIIYFS